MSADQPQPQQPCSLCNGTGRVEFTAAATTLYPAYEPCPRCQPPQPAEAQGMTAAEWTRYITVKNNRRDSEHQSIRDDLRARPPAPIPPDDEDTRRWTALTDRVIELEQQLRTVTAYYHATHVLPACVSWQDCRSEPCRTVRQMLGVTHEH